ncbi:exo 1,3/1,4-beta-D-glucan glucohydrolase [Luteimonas fraxinea]|uniref:Exo 1,3/1,4-beta-D-glucan glucohydrolase n=1 Tax=Luteimonas fraxinea TaxID=2901869 RepID=A0ABS8U9N5_9GAMM|nr:exo 1,3/1,4-beta-D-glucan glucohydrolase [Luteimonas fraxinea]MCD9095464.1 exo 1,3/1,4-beta-D-glucan glucohydrolase [Luteimonas fraxinea]MCD9126295.1 exo 1,3/1,4-beta-D-glucan glucohydrolase [Luteimonas fraxinea]UHH11330.1 exo 1,3/1,4-beta-D-glucan glucohydrolase [Luteimonas fraxinea]
MIQSHRPAHRSFHRALLPAMLAALVLGACARDDAPATAAAPAPGAANAADPAAIDPANWPETAWPLAEDPALEQKITELMATMTVEEKVGQIVQGDIADITPEDLRKYRLGSILAGGNSDPGGRYDAAPAEWLKLADAFWEASMDTAGGGKAIPVIFGIDAVHGQSNIVGATLFPHNIGLGATRNAELMREIGRVTAIETRTTGMEWAFAPTVAVPQDDRWGRTYEGYSESPDIVAAFAPAVVEGMQGKAGSPDFLDDHHVMVSVKHYLGDGGTAGGKDQGETAVTEAQLRDIHGAGYPPAIAAGAQAVMASFNSVHGQRMHGHKALLTDVLKDRMNFGGFVVGDWNGHGQLPGCTTTDCAATFNAGLDMAMAPDSWRGLYDSTVKHVQSGELPMARLDDAVRRILRVKFRMGLFDAPKPSERALGGKFELLGAPEHREVARRAVRESLVLLKNDGVLPLAPNQRVLVAGDGADDMGKQSGGWTLNWQGTGTKRADYPNADTIWDGIRTQVTAAGGTAHLAVDGTYGQKPDVAIVVFGEDPYAEFLGDLPNLLYKPGDDADLELVKRLRAEGIPVVSVFLSGRPLWVNREINASNAFVAAWLPGSEGAGVADVLLQGADGKPQHDFKGKLSFSWPRRGNQYVNNVGMEGYDPLFAFGHGLTYADDGKLAALPEDAGVSAEDGKDAGYFARGVPGPGLRLVVTGADGRGADVLHPRVATPDGTLTLAAVDYQTQEGARLLTWTGNATAELLSHSPSDLSRETNGDSLLLATLRIDALPASGDTVLYAGCGEGCKAELPIGPWLATLPRGEWITAGVPLKCLTVAGLDATRVSTPFAIRAPSGLTLGLADIRIGTEATHKLDCKTQ